MEPMRNSLRSCLALAIARGSPRAFGSKLRSSLGGYHESAGPIGGNIPENYARYMEPAIFAPWGADLG